MLPLESERRPCSLFPYSTPCSDSIPFAFERQREVEVVAIKKRRCACSGHVQLVYELSLIVLIFVGLFHDFRFVQSFVVQQSTVRNLPTSRVADSLRDTIGVFCCWKARQYVP